MLSMMKNANSLLDYLVVLATTIRLITQLNGLVSLVLKSKTKFL